MKKWIDDHIGWIVGTALLILFGVVVYFVSINICWTCPAVNITSGDLIT